ncbi:MAG TPA: NAD-dependent epimerase/dehydratase family protein [Dinghuibacter sp.]|jgi:nucleoside-diphosphate-sugar epimerase|uniref:NAD-dependent epimerase/dehydratase family protein n=1 Tax=Dinghuibacter sp. TaxID=2024697 RepID=UPI002C649260|nr:NAD-dependent epimerase/dehydratase family protein [Dinghuibacter sp.]HTJ13969.1 NAD-dependent epimerase/dehydratase family protein [Dinghuibacter sp.]
MVLVTGGTGLVGSYLIKTLLDEGTPVRALYRRPYDGFVLSRTECERVEWVQGDLLDVVSLEDAMTGVTQLYHCAAIVSFSPKTADTLLKVNTEGTANVVNAALTRQVRKMVYVSSVSALGRLRQDAPIDESTQWTEETNNSRYGLSKYYAEMEVWRGIAEGLQAVIVNPTIVLGAGDWEKGSAGLFKSAYDEFPWYTEGVSGFVDVRDVARAMVALMNSPLQSERYLLSGDNWTYRQLFTAMATAFGRRSPHKAVTPFLGEVVWRMEKIKSLFTGKEPLVTRETARTAQAVTRFDSRKIQEALPGFRFTPLEEAIRYHVEALKVRYVPVA